MKDTIFHRNPWAAALATMFLVSLGLYLSPMLGKTFFAGPDTLSPTALSRGLADLAAETGEVPLWQPGLFSGMPSVHAFNSSSSQYLPDQFFRPFRALGLPVVWIFVFHLVFGGFGVWLLIRSLGGSFAASLLGGMGFLLMPYTNTMLVHGHGGQMMTLAYLPWVIWALLRLYAKPTLPAAGLLALFTGLHLQRGHAQISYYILLMAGLTLVALLIKGWRESDRPIPALSQFAALSAAAFLVGFGLATALFIPVMNYAPFSIRGGAAGGGVGFDYATQWSFSFGETATWLSPSFYGFGGPTYWGGMPFTDYPNYMGILLLGLAVWAVWRVRSMWTWTLLAGGGIAYFLSLGDNFFLYRLFYELFPYFDKFRVPSMLLVLTQFSVVILAGLGLDDLLKALEKLKPSAGRHWFRMAGGTLVGLVLLLLASAAFMSGNFPADQRVPPAAMTQINQLRVSMIRGDALWLLALGVAILLLLLLWKQERLSRNWMLAGLITVSSVDLARIDRQIIDPPEGSLRRGVQQPTAFRAQFLASDPITEFLSAESDPFRIYPLGGLQNDNRWSAFGISSISGYHPAKLANYDRFMKATGFRSGGILQMLNVHYLVSLNRFSDPRFEEATVGNLFVRGQYIPAAVYRFKDGIPRAWFPAAVVAHTSDQATLQALLQAGYDPRDTVYVDAADDGRLPATALGTLQEADWGAGHISLVVQVDQPGLLVISEIFYPQGWVARVDGAEVPIWRVNTILRGVELPAGKLRLTLDFEPADVRWGRAISRLSLLLILLSFTPLALARFRQPA